MLLTFLPCLVRGGKNHPRWEKEPVLPDTPGVSAAGDRALEVQGWPLLTIDVVGPKRKQCSNTAPSALHTHARTHACMHTLALQ